MRQLIHADDFRAYAIRPYSSLGKMQNSFFHICNLKVNVKIKRKGGDSQYKIENASLILVSNVNYSIICLFYSLNVNLQRECMSEYIGNVQGYFYQVVLSGCNRFRNFNLQLGCILSISRPSSIIPCL